MIVWSGMDLLRLGVFGAFVVAWLLWLLVIWIRGKLGRKP